MALTTMSKINFWNKLRVDRNIRYKDIAELYGGCASRWGSYFSGQIMPADEQIHQLCDLFDVDFETGKAEFEKAHANWESARHMGKRVVTGEADPYNRGEMPARMVFGEASATPEKVDVFSMLYGKVSYETFNLFCKAVAEKQDAMQYCYGVVSYEEYKKIEEVIYEKREN